jgi:hypothetical protein
MTTNTAKPTIDRTAGSEETNPAIPIGATSSGHESVYIGKLNPAAILRIWQGGYRVLVKHSASGKWMPGRGLEDTSGLPLRGDIPDLVQHLTGKPLSQEGETLLSMLPKSANVCYAAVVRRDEGRLLPLPYLNSKTQALRAANAFRGY